MSHKTAGGSASGVLWMQSIADCNATLLPLGGRMWNWVLLPIRNPDFPQSPRLPLYKEKLRNLAKLRKKVWKWQGRNLNCGCTGYRHANVYFNVRWISSLLVKFTRVSNFCQWPISKIYSMSNFCQWPSGEIYSMSNFRQWPSGEIYSMSNFHQWPSVDNHFSFLIPHSSFRASRAFIALSVLYPTHPTLLTPKGMSVARILPPRFWCEKCEKCDVFFL